MNTLLYIQASPRAGRSYSVQVAEAFIEAYRQAHPRDKVKTIDVLIRPSYTFSFRPSEGYKGLGGCRTLASPRPPSS